MKYRGVAHIATPLHFRYRALYSKSIVPCTLNRKHQEEFICAHTNMRLCHTFSQKIRGQRILPVGGEAVSGVKRSQSEHEESYVTYATELCPERLYLGIE